VDYKTGDIESTYTKEKLKKGNLEKEEIGGDYWRQAIFYKLLFDNTTLHKYNVRNAVYEFVEPNKKTHLLPEPFYFDFPKEEVDMVKNQIHQTWEKIQSHDFYTGCGKENCEWCNLTKQLKS
jgi:DNA helicase-2/ATP-dependent DNA helicase PcrA